MDFLKYFLLLLLILFNSDIYSQNKYANIDNIDFQYLDGKIQISYDIINSSDNEVYSIVTNVFGENGNQLNAVSLSGDMNNVNGGIGKVIIWDQYKDDYVLDQKIYITLSISTKANIPLSKHFLKSTIYPGWGDYKLRNGKFYFLYGMVGFGAIGASIYMDAQASQNYNNYKNSMDIDQSNALYLKAKQQQALSYIFATSAAFVWTFDLAFLINKSRKVNKNITMENSNYYFNKTHNINSATSSKKYINTKQPYDKAIDKGDKFLDEGVYSFAKKAYEEALSIDETELVISKIKTVDSLIEVEKVISSKYNSSITKAQILFDRKEYKDAKAEFEIAHNLKPNEKYPVVKIIDIEKIINQIENQGILGNFLDFKSLYSDNNIKVEVSFKNYGCLNNNKKNLIKFRYKGSASFSKEYLVWTFDYYDCNGNLRFKTISLDISLENINNIRKDEWQETINTDDEFDGKAIKYIFYSVYLSKTKVSNTGYK